MTQGEPEGNSGSPLPGVFSGMASLLLLGSGLRLVDAGADTLLITLATDALLCLGVLLAHGQCFLKGLKMQEMGCEER